MIHANISPGLLEKILYIKYIYCYIVFLLCTTNQFILYCKTKTSCNFLRIRSTQDIQSHYIWIQNFVLIVQVQLIRSDKQKPVPFLFEGYQRTNSFFYRTKQCKITHVMIIRLRFKIKHSSSYKYDLIAIHCFYRNKRTHI